MFVEAVEIDANWVAPSYPHTEEEVARLHEYVSKTVLLSHLDQQAKDTVIAAFQKLSYSSGQDIITQARSSIPTDPWLRRTRSRHSVLRTRERENADANSCGRTSRRRT